jgi:hypothetical protein
VTEHAFKYEREIGRGEAPDDGLADVRAAIRTLTRTKDRDVPNAHVFGIHLARIKEKVRDGRRIVCSDDRTGAKLWRVETIETP